ncbi:Uncharacterized protein TCM_028053 [Theobroma cacao]|uniref:Reverse transcriptase zinc-binding domain-containing protein n=1 Tax=Theobroma cacao TaxID=3641 RepID=A0A061GA28_THECC|nr:Uncharacterized protein TCM_028053 [Theobroma cacao]
MMIAMTVGKPLFIEEATTNGSHPIMAHVCVEYYYQKAPLYHVWIVSRDRKTGAMIGGFSQRVEFSKLLDYCIHCLHVGHSISICMVLGNKPENSGVKKPLPLRIIKQSDDLSRVQILSSNEEKLVKEVESSDEFLTALRSEPEFLNSVGDDVALEGLWMVGGDFNSILSSDEWLHGASPHDGSMEDFATALLNCGLIDIISQTTYFLHKTLFVIYLGAPLFKGLIKILLFDSLITKIRDRISRWENKILSPGGRITLLWSVLSSMPIYLLQILKPPMTVIEKIERLFNSFLWVGSIACKKTHWVAWSKISFPCLEEGA